MGNFRTLCQVCIVCCAQLCRAKYGECDLADYCDGYSPKCDDKVEEKGKVRFWPPSSNSGHPAAPRRSPDGKHKQLDMAILNWDQALGAAGSIPHHCGPAMLPAPLSFIISLQQSTPVHNTVRVQLCNLSDGVQSSSSGQQAVQQSD